VGSLWASQFVTWQKATQIADNKSLLILTLLLESVIPPKGKNRHFGGMDFTRSILGAFVEGTPVQG
jgi:hypothetical protein